MKIMKYFEVPRSYSEVAFRIGPAAPYSLCHSPVAHPVTSALDTVRFLKAMAPSAKLVVQKVADVCSQVVQPGSRFSGRK